jgi:nucleotide-binding universal stress UspA family protein
MAFRRIIVAVDGADASAAALETAVWLARQGDATLTGLCVRDTGWDDFIGNDWQSSSNARRGFLAHIGAEQEALAEAARHQFASAAAGLAAARFEIATGDPVQVLLARLADAATDLVVFGRRTFQVSGRPSLKSAARTLAHRGQGALLLLP